LGHIEPLSLQLAIKSSAKSGSTQILSPGRIWIAIAVINIAYARRNQPGDRH